MQIKDLQSRSLTAYCLGRIGFDVLSLHDVPKQASTEIAKLSVLLNLGQIIHSRRIYSELLRVVRHAGCIGIVVTGQLRCYGQGKITYSN